jgi:hypothetical protein
VAVGLATGIEEVVTGQRLEYRWLPAFEHRDHVLGFGPTGIIRVQARIQDRAVLADDVARGHWKGPAWIAVERQQRIFLSREFGFVLFPGGMALIGAAAAGIAGQRIVDAGVAHVWIAGQ